MIEEIEENYFNEVRQIDRDGTEDYIDMKRRTDFLVAPASRNHHCSFKSGLMVHEWKTFECLEMFVRDAGMHDPDHPHYIPKDSRRIAGLFHDDCKINFYEEDAENWTPKQKSCLEDLLDDKSGYVEKHGLRLPRDEKGNLKPLSKNYASDLIGWLIDNPEEKPPEIQRKWKINDKMPLGHGEKSVMVVQNYINLTLEEMLAIRWHMAAYESGTLDGDKKWAYSDALEKSMLVKMLHLADQWATEKEQWIMDI